MNTFLPYADFSASAAALDNRRLGCQRKEVLQILAALRQGPRCLFDTFERKYIYGLVKPDGRTVWRPTPWHNHPAVKMWKGHEASLCRFGIACSEEWLAREYNDTCMVKFSEILDEQAVDITPPWLGRERFHSSMRTCLLRKMPLWYRKYGWVDDGSKDIAWPVV